MSNASSKRSLKRRGFSLIEALASVTILGLGIAAVVGGLGAVARTETRTRQIEAMTRLAQHKFDELVATSTSLGSSTIQNGDFSDQNNSDYSWSAQVEDTGITNLEALTVTVTPSSDTSSKAPTGIVTGLIYVAPAATTTTTATPGRAGG